MQARTEPSPTDVAPSVEEVRSKPIVTAAITTHKQPALAPRAAEPAPAPEPKREFTQTINQVVGLQPQNFAAFNDDGPAKLRGDLAQSLSGGMKLIEQGDWIQGRRALSDLLRENELQLPAADAQAIRDVLMSVNQKLIFSRQVYQGDPLTEEYKIQSGDFLSTIAPRFDTTFELLGKINNIDPNRIRLGQRIKIVRGPMHAVVDKSAFRMDVYSTADGGKPLYVTSFAVGCGEENSTPIGNFTIAKDGKIPDPAWNNPRTGERFASNDPKNPIGEYWLGLEGADDLTRNLRGYGIHGTIVPDSIGKNMSMGCVRLRPDDIEMVYCLLIPVKSTVTIRP
jgi:lipoprotein-anchoring transpeptidase ErfK/SrfK